MNNKTLWKLATWAGIAIAAGFVAFLVVLGWEVIRG